jgi:hypothetical protein
LKTAAAKVRLFVLNQNSDRSREIAVGGTATEAQVEIGPQYQTLWYELIIE